MNNLEEIYYGLRIRKISFDEKELTEWLIDYSSYFKEKYKTRLSIEEIMFFKAFYLLMAADEIYWKYDKNVRFVPVEREKIPECCRYDYDNKLIPM
ncbi:MAG: hypothetical protein QW103_01865 [Candidatus Pacearchaeota archaeon]